MDQTSASTVWASASTVWATASSQHSELPELCWHDMTHMAISATIVLAVAFPLLTTGHDPHAN